MGTLKSSIVKLKNIDLSKNIIGKVGFDKIDIRELSSLNLEAASFFSVIRATYLYQAGSYDEARQFYFKALNVQPNNAYLNFKYGMTYYKTKKWAEAYKYIKKAIELDPNKDFWNIQLQTSEKHLINELPLKEQEFEEALDIEPNNIQLRESYAACLFDNKKYWLARIQLEKLLVLQPYSEKVLFKLGLTHEMLSDYINAIKYFDRVVSLNVDNLVYKYHLGYCYERLGNIEQSGVYYDIIEMCANRSSDLARFGVGVLHAKNKQWDCALKSYKEYLNKKKSTDPDLLFRIAITYERLYEWKKAAETYEKSINLSAVVNPNWCYKCGQAYEKSGLYQKAVTYYKESVARTSVYQPYWWYRLGCSLNAIGDFKASAEVFGNSRRRKYLHAVSPKGVIKNKTQEYLSYYAEYYETLSIKENVVLIESFLGNTISGNPYAMLLYMIKKEYNFTYVISITKNTVIPDSLKFNRNIIFIERGSDSYLRYLCSAKYLINNVTFPYYFTRKSGQVYLNTWHGTPMKTLGKDIKEPFQDHANVARNFLQATHIVSQNRYTSNILLDRYDIKNMFNGKIAETGYPRVDLSLNQTFSEKQQIRSKLGITSKKPVILYAPTWRGNSESRVFDNKKLEKDLKYLSDPNYHIIFKGHHLAEKLLANIDISNILIAPKDIDTNQLLGITDILITDYSSILYDFLCLNKPIISYIYDFDDYIKTRGLYLTKEDMLGSVCENIKKVKKSVNELIKYNRSNVPSHIIEKYVPYEDGNSSKRAVDFMFDIDDSRVWSYRKDKQLLFFEGPFIPNGISRSFLNLMSSINNNNYHVTIIINRIDVAKMKSRIEEFNKLPANVSIISRVGSAPMTLEEIRLRDEFEKNYEFYSPDYEHKLINLYKRETRRLIGDSHVDTAINFEGYALFWVSLFSQIKANKKIIFQHSDKYLEWKTRFPYLKGVFEWYKYYDVIASVSRGTMENNKKNLTAKFGLPESKFTYINNSINIQEILDNANENIESLEDCFINYQGIKFINVGRMSQEKDQLKLIDAFAEVRKKNKNVRLYILGDGDLRSDLQSKIESLKLENDVYLLGQKKNPFVYLKHSDVFVLSSNHEGQPMVLLEALTIGLPVIATDIVGNRSVLGEEYGILVENSVAGLVHGMSDFIKGKIRSTQFDAVNYQNDAINKFNSIVS